MNACKMILRDLREGTLRSKRVLLLMLVTVLQCMLVQMDFDLRQGEFPLYHLREMLIGVFGGSAPMTITGRPAIPYGWFGIFACMLFVPFDYPERDLSQFGMQILMRQKKRTAWWAEKCVWCVLTAIFCYLVVFGTTALFCLAAGIPLSLGDNPRMIPDLIDTWGGLTPRTDLDPSSPVFTQMLIAPLLVFIALSLFQMALGLLIKPVYSFAATVGWLVLSFAVDWSVAFPRLAMLRCLDVFYLNGYPILAGVLVSVCVIVVSVCGGTAYFRCRDILPEKEAS